MKKETENTTPVAQYCHTHNCTSRDKCALAHISNQHDYFFGQGGDSDRCEDFVSIESA